MTAALFAVSALLWGGGALASVLQAGLVPAPVSVSYRMAIAALVLLAWAMMRRIPLALPVRDGVWVAAQGLLFFALAFTSFYEATSRIPGGLAALVLSTAPVFATLLARVTLSAPINPRCALGISLGIAGVALVFGVDVPPGLDPHTALAGLFWALAAALATAAGPVIGARNQRAGIPVVTTLVWGAIVGAVATALWALGSGLEFRFDPSVRYVASLAYLAIMASVVAFLIYFHLVGRLGPGRAAYALAVVPVVALLLSALFEGLALTPVAGGGVVLILTGNVLVLRG
ncbi:MAG: DMT family transporter [Thalassobaculaceae bacterium]|nr:DMT family transporter [Thalassobaculaceae bacterium]